MPELSDAQSLSPGARLRAERLDKKVLRVCETAGAFIEYWGFKAIHGKVWALLALHEAPLAQHEIAEKFNVSRSLLSSTISELEEFGLVRPTNNHRNAPYQAALDVWPTIAEVLRTREWMLLESTRVALESAIEDGELCDSIGDTPSYSVNKMKLLLKMTEAAQGFLRIIVTMRMPKASDGLGSWVGRAQRLIKGMRSQL